MPTHPQRTPATLTDISVRNAPPKASRYELPDSRVRGLRLVVQPSGAKSWALRYVMHGRNRKLTLGPFDPNGLNLRKARELAAQRLLERRTGRDSVAERLQERRRQEEERRRAREADGNLFATRWSEYVAEYVRPELKRTTAREIERLGATLILPKFRDRSIADIRSEDIKAIMNAQKTRGVPTQGNKIFATLRQFFNWLRSDKLARIDNPCAGLKKTIREVPRERVLSDVEIQCLWRACEVIGYPFGPLTKLLLLSGARREEVRGMVWRELDLPVRTWTLPSHRTKNGREHSIHLSDASLAVLRSLPRIQGKAGLLFTTNGTTPSSGFSRAKSRLDKLMMEAAGEEVPDWRIHDLRRTAASGMARLGIALPVIERALNHVSGSFAGIVGVYQRHEFTTEKAAAFDAWSAHVMALVSAPLSYPRT